DRGGRRDEHGRPRAGDGGRDAADRRPCRRLGRQPVRPREARLTAPPATRGTVAGALAAALWKACDPLLKRTFGTPYVDSEVLGPLLAPGRNEWAANLATHVAGGATFGYLFARLGGRSVRQGVAAAV